MSLVADKETLGRLARLPIGQAIRERAKITPDAPVVREKQRGIYREHSWREYADDIEALAIGLLQRGVEPGDTVAIMGDPTYRWMLADAAIISIGAISFGIYTTCSPSEIQHQISTAGAVALIAENQEYVDKFLEISDDCPTVQSIIVDDTRALFGYGDKRITSFTAIDEKGRVASDVERRRFVERVGATKSDDPALLVFTSGTTGPSKAAAISSTNFLVGGGLQFCQMYPEVTEAGEHRIIAHLSLAHAFERIVALYSPILSSLVVHIGEDLESLGQTIHEVQPYMLHAVPRIWQKMAAHAVTNIDRSGLVKRSAYRFAMAAARGYHNARWESRSVGVWILPYAIARGLVFKPMLRKFGLAKARFALTGGTHIPPEVQRTWHYWGLNLHNVLGMTEVGFVAFQRGRFPHSGSVGEPVPDIEIEVAEDSELLYRGPGVFRGYLGDTEATREAISDKGWFHSGDVGGIENNELTITDRKKDIMITAGGKNLTPSLIENAVKASPYISEFVLIADGRKFPSGLVEVDAEFVGEWAKSQGLLFTGYTSLTKLPEVQALIDDQIKTANQELAQVEQVKDFRIIPKELDPEEGDTTPTRKIKRGHVEQMFSQLIGEMYTSERDEVARLA